MIQPISLYFGVSKVCNIRCKYCYVPEYNKSHQEDYDSITLKSVNEFIEKCHKEKQPIGYVALHGAEPTILSPEILAEVTNKFYKETSKAIRVQTNGTRLDFDYIFRMIQYDKNIASKLNVGISMDGHKSLHNKNRANTYDTVFANLHMALSYNFKVKLLIVVTPDTLKEIGEFEKFLDYMDSIKVQYRFKMAEHGYELSREENIEFAKWCIKTNRSGFTQALMDDICVNTGNACNFYEFDSDGKVYACNKSFFNGGSFGNWKEESFQSLKQKRTGLFKDRATSEECKSCEFNSICNSGCPVSRVENKAVDCELRKYFYNHIKLTNGKYPKIPFNVCTKTGCGACGCGSCGCGACGCGSCGCGCDSGSDDSDSISDAEFGEAEASVEANEQGVDHGTNSYSNDNNISRAELDDAIAEDFANTQDYNYGTNISSLDAPSLDSFNDDTGTAQLSDSFLGMDYSYDKHFYSSWSEYGTLAEAAADIAELTGTSIDESTAMGIDTVATIASIAMSIQSLPMSIAIAKAGISTSVTVAGIAATAASVASITDGLNSLASMYGATDTYSESASSLSSLGSFGGSSSFINSKIQNFVIKAEKELIAQERARAAYFSDMLTGAVFDKMAGGRLYQSVFAGDIYFDATRGPDTDFSVGREFSLSAHALRVNAPYAEFLPKNQAGTDTFSVLNT